MMMPRTKKLARGIVSCASLAAAASLALVACTHDFDAYQAVESGSGPGDGSIDTGTMTVGQDATTPTRNDGAVTPPMDASTADTSTGCAQAAACGAAETTCKSKCDATLATCNAACGGGNGGCKTKCQSDRDKCYTDCTTTCHTCAGAACLTACN